MKQLITAVILTTVVFSVQAETRVPNKPHTTPMFLIEKSVSASGNPIGVFRLQWKDGTSSFSMFEAKCGTMRGKDLMHGEGSARNMKASMPVPNSDSQGFYQMVGAGGQGSTSYNKYQALCS